MASRIIPLFVLGFSLVLADARILETDITDFLTANKNEMIFTKVVQNERLCTLCEEFTAETINYLTQNDTQKEIMDTLHSACSTVHSFEKQCTIFVDYYASLFFKVVATVDPHTFCEKFQLCEKETLLSLMGQDQVCTICHDTINRILDKLKDPETELDIVQTLLKACDQLENYSQQCKRLVFQYGPIILANAEKFLESGDVCKSLHFCKENEASYTRIGEMHMWELPVSHSPRLFRAV